METTRSDIPQESLKPATEPSGLQLAQAETPATPPAPAPDAGRAAAAAGSAPDDDGPGADSVLSEFLADGPPLLPQEDDADQAAGQRPVQMQPEGQDAAPPVETAAGDGGPVSGGVSFYRDTFGVLDPSLAPSEMDAEPPGLAAAGGAVVVDQFGAPIVLTSLAVATPGDSVLDVPVPPPAPIPADPGPETDPLTERRIAEGVPDEEIEDDEDDNGSSVDGTAGDDILAGGGGDDTLTGGGGTDVFSFSLAANQGADVITDFTTGSGGDTLQLTDVADSNGDSTVELADLDDGTNTIMGTADSLVLDFANGASVTLDGVDGTGITTFAELETSEVNTDVS